MVRLLLFAILAYVLWRLLWRGLKGVFEGMGYRAPGGTSQSVGLVRDPVCGTFVLPSSALTSGSGANTRFFCSAKCREDYGHRRSTGHSRNTEETQHGGNTGHRSNPEETQ
jgi:YHS domain-containing protein